MDSVTHFLGIKFEIRRQESNDATIHMSQETLSEKLLQHVGWSSKDPTNPSATPNWSSHPIDNIKNSKILLTTRATLTDKLRSLIGSLL